MLYFLVTVFLNFLVTITILQIAILLTIDCLVPNTIETKPCYLKVAIGSSSNLFADIRFGGTISLKETG